MINYRSEELLISKIPFRCKTDHQVIGISCAINRCSPSVNNALVKDHRVKTIDGLAIAVGKLKIIEPPQTWYQTG